jgi:hypothetical protein
LFPPALKALKTGVLVLGKSDVTSKAKGNDCCGKSDKTGKQQGFLWRELR